MTFSEYKNELKGKIETMIAERQKFALIASGDLVAMIADRLTNDGVDADKNKFPSYSENELPLFYFKGQKTNRSGAYDSFEKKVRKGLVSSYKNWREHNGLPTDKRTHVFTADMIKSIRPEVIEDTDVRTVVEIKSRKDDLQKRLNWNSNRMGISLIKPTEDEKLFVEELNTERFRKILFT